MVDTDHIVFTTEGFMWCMFCGCRERVLYPVSVTDFSKIANVFAAKHKDCKEKK